jgi:two-component system NtrC family sensor kinase
MIGMRLFMELHPLLLRLLKKSNMKVSDVNSLSPNCQHLFELINESFLDFEEDRMLLERSIDISSREYIEQIDQIHNLQATLVSNEKIASLGRLSAGIAHEINNPLGFIKSNMETLSKYLEKITAFHKIKCDLFTAENDNDTQRMNNLKTDLRFYSEKNKIEMIYEDLPNMISETFDGIQRISKIVISLLSFSRNSTMSDFEDYNFSKGLKDTINIAYNELKYYAVIEEDYEEIPDISAKPGEVNQVLLNIIMNAVYAIRSTGVKGVLSLHTYAESSYVCCVISDNGGGIPQEYMSRIFEPFFTTKPVGTGTGLGLSISYDIIVNKHNGKIDVESEVGKGTTFTIKLPVKRERINM